MKKIIYISILLFLNILFLNTFAQWENIFWVGKVNINNNKEKIIYLKLNKFDDIKIDKIQKKATIYKLKANNEDKKIIEEILKEIIKIKTERKLKEDIEFKNLLDSIKKEIKTNKKTLPWDFSDL